MCGVPWHAAENYISVLVRKGYKIALCDQMEDPRQARGLVKRAVTRVMTSGTALEDANLEAQGPTPISARCSGTPRAGRAALPGSTCPPAHGPAFSPRARRSSSSGPSKWLRASCSCPTRATFPFR